LVKFAAVEKTRLSKEVSTSRGNVKTGQLEIGKKMLLALMKFEAR
ncbi:unnamed protein product, partial [Heterotrigona itama]